MTGAMLRSIRKAYRLDVAQIDEIFRFIERLLRREK